MNSWLRRVLYGTNEKKSKNNRRMKRWGMLIILIMGIQIFMHGNHVIAASGVKIYNYTTKKEYTYSDAQVKVTYNGKKISVDSTPGLIQDGIALVSYKDIFAKSAIKADCVYDKAAGTISISQFGTTIVMKIGSKTAHINGKAVTAPVAPVKIKYVKDDVTKILVPSRFVAENLGYVYTWNKNTSTVSIEYKNPPLHLSYNDGEKFYYNGTQGKVTIDGQNINLGKMPSIITNNTAMVRAKKVFAGMEINADYKYDSKDKSITLSRNGNVLKMKVDSPVAYLNDKAIILDTPPMIVTNHNEGTSYVMVPGSITASCLGFDYQWDKNTMTSIITSREDEGTPEQTPDNEPEEIPDPVPEQNPDGDSEQTKDSEPELGDTSVKWDKGTVLYQWEAKKEVIGASSKRHTIDSGVTTDTGFIYSIDRDYSDSYQNTETYAIRGNSSFNKVSSEIKGGKILINISNMTCVENTYYFKNSHLSILNTIRAYNSQNTSSILELDISSDTFTYDLSLSADKQTLYITIYYNSINKAVIGTNNDMDYITLTGNSPLKAVINQMPGLLVIEIPGTKKSIEDQSINTYNMKKVTYASIYHTTDRTTIYLGLKSDSEYYIAEDGNNYTIMLPSGEKPFTPPVVPEVPEEPREPDVPVAPEYPADSKNNYQLVIPNPAGISANKITHEDQYNKLRFSIRIPGDHVSYLKANPILVNSKAIKDAAVFLNSNNETEILVSTTKIQGYEIYADKNFIYVKVGNPKDIYKNIVVLDAGHGGTDPGAHYNNMGEKYFNFKILYEIGKEFFNSNPAQLKVYYTRETDVLIPLADRAAFAKQIGADLFVSLHMNANTNKTVYGTEVYYSNDNNKKNSAGLNSQTLAKIFVDNISSSLNTKNRGTRAAKYTVVHKNTVPAVLIELAFMSNDSDFKRINDSTFQYNAAKTIYKTLLEVFEKYPTGR